MSLREQLQVLVVDDMATSRGLITQALDTIGMPHVATASSAEEALGTMSARAFHLVISDFNMPGMDGLQMLKSIRERSGGDKVGFLLVTGKPDPETISLGQSLGMNNFIAKPFSVEDLKGAIEAVFGRL